LKNDLLYYVDRTDAKDCREDDIINSLNEGSHLSSYLNL
jgi:hypothetical protein